MADPVPWAFSSGGERSEQLDWLTDVTPTATGPEQLRCVRVSPRIVLGASGLEKGRPRQWLETLLHRQGMGHWWVPLDTDALRVGTALAISATTVAGDASLLRFAVGGKALLLGDDPAVSELVEVESFNGSGVVLAGGVTKAWPVGSRLVPAYRANFDRMPALERFTGDVVAYSVAFRLAETLDVVPADWLPVYRGFQVLEMTSDWSNDPQWSPDREPMVVDMDIALPVLHDLIGQPRAKLGRAITAIGRTGIVALLRVLYLLKGRWQPLWVPSLGHDLRAAAGVTSAGVTMNVDWCGLVDAGIQTTRRDIRIALIDGTVLYRRITGVAAVNSTTERITVNAAWGATIPLAAIAHVGFMTFARQEADTNKLIWWSGDVVQTDLGFVGIVDHDV
ncbi:MAG: hypothetical protein ACOH2M_23295 [Cypionkella sp.]